MAKGKKGMNILLMAGIFLFSVLFIGLISWLIILLTKKSETTPPPTTTTPPPTTTTPPPTTTTPPPTTTTVPSTTTTVPPTTTTVPPTTTTVPPDDVDLTARASTKGSILASSLDGKYISLLSDRSQQYCSDTDMGITCGSPVPQYSEKFLVNDLGNGIIALQGGRLNKYCTDTGNEIICNSDNIGPEQQFKLAHYSDSGDIIALRRGTNWDKYCSDKGGIGIVCNNDLSDPFITFEYQLHQKICDDYNGQNVKCSSRPDDIYKIQGGEKSKYISMGAFDSTNANRSEIKTIDCGIIDSCPTGDEIKGSLQYQASECQNIGKIWSAIEQKCVDQPVTTETAQQACINRGGRWVNGQCYRMS